MIEAFADGAPVIANDRGSAGGRRSVKAVR